MTVTLNLKQAVTIAEIRNLLSVRFLKSDRDKKAQLVNTDVPFRLTLCQL
ncbi:hypothetical protein [Polynucleobacter sphagniphilus]|nr:hypothetical protein [Polynucleobacter sphagniphilus]